MPVHLGYGFNDSIPSTEPLLISSDTVYFSCSVATIKFTQTDHLLTAYRSVVITVQLLIRISTPLDIHTDLGTLVVSRSSASFLRDNNQSYISLAREPHRCSQDNHYTLLFIGIITGTLTTVYIFCHFYFVECPM